MSLKRQIPFSVPNLIRVPETYITEEYIEAAIAQALLGVYENRRVDQNDIVKLIEIWMSLIASLYEKIESEVKFHDVVVISFDALPSGLSSGGNCEKTQFWMHQECFPLRVDESSVVPGVLELIKMKPGEIRSINVKFSKDFISKELAEREVKYKVRLHGIWREKPGSSPKSSFRGRAADFRDYPSPFRAIFQEWLDLRQKRVNRNMIVRHLLAESHIVPPAKEIRAHRESIIYYLIYQFITEGMSGSSIRNRIDSLDMRIGSLAYELGKAKKSLRWIARSKSLRIQSSEFSKKIHELSATYLTSASNLYQFLKHRRATLEVAEGIMIERVLSIIGEEVKTEFDDTIKYDYTVKPLPMECGNALFTTQLARHWRLIDNFRGFSLSQVRMWESLSNAK